MKKKGELLTMRGQVEAGSVQAHRLQIFDGKYSTGYRVIEFYISPDNPQDDNKIIAKLTTNKNSTNNDKWDWQDNREIAWHSWGISRGLAGGDFFLIDENNMVIEDLYLSILDSTDPVGPVNYFIVMQKYEFPTWTGAGYLVENLGQGGPQ